MNDMLMGLDTVTVDQLSGHATFTLPVAKILGDQDGRFALSLSCELPGRDITFLPHGTWSLYWGGLNASTTRLTLSNLRVLEGLIDSVKVGQDGLARDNGYQVDAEKYLEALSKHVADTGATKGFNKHSMVTVTTANGALFVFDLCRTHNEGNYGNALLKNIVTPLGRKMTLTWADEASAPKLQSISDAHGTLLKVDWLAGCIHKICLFPDTDDQADFMLAFADEQVEITQSTGSAQETGIIHRLSGTKSRINRVELLKVFGDDAAPVLINTLDLVFSDEKLKSQNLLRPGQASGDGFVTEFSYLTDDTKATRETTITCSRGHRLDSDKKRVPIVLANYKSTYHEGTLISSTSVIGDTTYEVKREVEHDDVNNRLRLVTTRLKNAEEVERIILTFDVMGNLIAREHGDLVTEWTYYNDYHLYSLAAENKRVSTINAKNFFSKWFFAAVDYANPVGWGFLIFGNKGLTWHDDTTYGVSVSNVGSRYAQEAFNLPVDLNYPGSTAGYCNHVESELVSKRVGNTLQALSLTYYGYEACTPIKQEGLKQPDLVRQCTRLTVRDPKFERVDISKTQYEIAAAYAKPYKRLLDKKASSTKDPDEKASVESMLKGLEDSLVEQSKLNGIGFKLSTPWVDGKMRLETIVYETDENNPGFGMPAKTLNCLLDDKGVQKASSLLTSVFSTERDFLSTRKIKKTVALSVAQQLARKSSVTRSELTGRLYERSLGDESTETWEYDKAGILKKECVSTGERHEVWDHAVTYTSDGLSSYRLMTTDSGCGTRVVADAQGQILETWLTRGEADWLKLSAQKYDLEGRVSCRQEFDYDAGDKKLMEFRTDYQFGHDTNAVNIRRSLWNAAGQEVDVVEQTVSYSDETLLWSSGTFSIEKHVDQAKHTETLARRVAGKEAFTKENIFDVQGRLVSTTYGITKGKSFTPMGSATLAYNASGEIRKLIQEVSGVSGTQEFEYDHWGRLAKHRVDDRIVEQQFSEFSVSPDPLRLSISSTTAPNEAILLGEQTQDSFGRLTSRRANGVDEFFGPVVGGASPVTATANESQNYSATWDSKALTLTDSVTLACSLSDAEGAERSTVSVYSRQGRLLAITDLLGNETRYTYDALGRVVKAVSPACSTTSCFRDDGLLMKEIILQRADGHTMYVTYEYDAAGRETARTFESQGMPTHSMHRAYGPGGLLQKSELRIAGVYSSADAYTYDSAGHLASWQGKGKSYSEGSISIDRESFKYDVLGNVIEHKTLDVTGTRTDVYKRSFNAATSTEAFKRSFDAATKSVWVEHEGRHLTRDNRGNLHLHGLTYDAAGRPLSYETPRLHTFTFQHDFTGRFRSLYQKNSASVSNAMHFHYRNARIYARTSCSDHRSGIGDMLKVQDLILLNDSPGCYLQLDRRNHQVKDPNNIPTVSTSFEMRDASGTVVCSYTVGKGVRYFVYSAYGYRSHSDFSEDWLGFKGEAILPDSVYYLGSNRIYSPEYMTFTSPDSLSPFGVGGANAYAYCAGDPINYHDPSGHQRVAQIGFQGSTLLETKEFRYVLSAIALLTAPVTGGSSFALAAAVTGLAVVASGFEIASLVLEDSDPELARKLGYVSMGLGVLSAVGAFAVTARGSARALSSTARRRSAMDTTVESVLERFNSQGLTGTNVHTSPFNETFTLYSAPGSRGLFINGHGVPIEGYVRAGGVAIPEYFATTLAPEVRFFTRQGWKAAMHGHSYASTFNGTRKPIDRIHSHTVPNYLLDNLSTADLITELPGLEGKTAQQINDVIGGYAVSEGVDYVALQGQATFDSVLSTLAAHGYSYDYVGAMFCRGSNSLFAPSEVPKLVYDMKLAAVASALDIVDWTKGVRKMP
ncbi:RHS repeat-associated core domain-containing protein [Pseudomonas cremoricolorata]|uniref:RHS repeat-associated core domain-containing protein n=1 Tax=Pseudomonas cremoricolorata TaxID=157783 RepID=UPI000426DC23|nr:RHS repeat-associated core domain-containing protein [Pseudomonas cremoricolorata]